jgi:hypothetical protein
MLVDVGVLVHTFCTGLESHSAVLMLFSFVFRYELLFHPLIVEDAVSVVLLCRGSYVKIHPRVSMTLPLFDFSMVRSVD